MDDLKDIWSAAKDKEGKKPRVKFEKVFADHFLKLYDETKINTLTKMLSETFTTRGE